MSNPNDEIRMNLLKYFYDRNSSATSKYGKKGSAVKISDLKKAMKSMYELKQQQVVSNLNYLIDRGWVKSLDIEKTVLVRGGTVPSIVTWYEISAEGIDKIEGESEFQPVDRYPGINITATGGNIITLGDGNIVNTNYAPLHKELDALKKSLSDSLSLDNTQKLDVAVDIESIKDQLAKQQPNKTIIGNLWEGIEKIATIAGLTDLIVKISPLIMNLLPK
jgi:hypothetical protein